MNPQSPHFWKLAKQSCLAPALLAVGLFVLVGAAGAQDVQTVDGLNWLAGHWRTAAPPAAASTAPVSEEWWTEAGGGLMLGVHRDMRPGARSFFEYLRIEDSETGPVYQASPLGSEATPFPLTALEANGDEREATFENPDHDWPQRLVYLRRGDRLTIRADGLEDGARTASWELVLVP